MLDFHIHLKIILALFSYCAFVDLFLYFFKSKFSRKDGNFKDGKENNEKQDGKKGDCNKIDSRFFSFCAMCFSTLHVTKKKL